MNHHSLKNLAMGLLLFAGALLAFWLGLRSMLRQGFGPRSVPLGDIARHTGIRFPPGTRLRHSCIRQTPGESRLWAELQIPSSAVAGLLPSLPAQREESRRERLGIDAPDRSASAAWWNPGKPEEFVAARYTGGPAAYTADVYLLLAPGPGGRATVFLFREYPGGTDGAASGRPAPRARSEWR